MEQMFRRARRRVSIVALMACLLVASGCGSTSSDDEAVDDGATDGGATDDSSGGEAADGDAVDPAILAATGDGLSGDELDTYLARRYEAYWQAYDLARRAPGADPSTDVPELFELAAGEQLEISYSTIVELYEAGEAIREPEDPAIDGTDAATEHRIRIASVDEGVAELVGCLVNDDVRYVVGTGEVVNDAVITVESSATMARADGTWKVIRSQATSIEQGVSGCWLGDEADYPH